VLYITCAEALDAAPTVRRPVKASLIEFLKMLFFMKLTQKGEELKLVRNPLLNIIP
jgi:hypothetical protein